MEEFNWYEDAAEVDTEEFEPVTKEYSQFDQFFKVLNRIFKYVFTATVIIYIYRYIFHDKSFKLFNVNINDILFAVIIFCGSYNFIFILLYAVLGIISKCGFKIFEKRFQMVTKWAAMTIWFITMYYLLKNKEEMFQSFYENMNRFIFSGIVTGGMFTTLSLAIEMFYESFVANSLSSKVQEVDKREKIISAMKNYRYEISDSSIDETEGCNCTQIFFGASSDNNSDLNVSHINLNSRDGQNIIGALYFKPPELQSLHDAKTLAKDVFSKATENEEMNFSEFSEIFPNTQIAIQAFSYFDVNNDQTISKKEFKDALIGFYVARVNLEKGFEIAKGFVQIVSNIAMIAVFLILFLSYLVIFGIPLKDLLALALSSALVLNFAMSGLATDMYFNVMVLLSHPFDIGDDIIVDNENYTVFKIGLSSTSLLAKNGGKVKMMNRDLWSKTIINMTRAPEKVLFFTFKLSPDIDPDLFRKLKSCLHKYLKTRTFDFYETFSLEASSEQATDINVLDCALVLKCRSYKTKAKKFGLRAEINKYLMELFEELQIKTI
ncbi:Small Conductance Mechanosensitive Ion Channel (MscS) Family [Pseudoloma neurophilia]|uniref:Small Conductance Mechanosensitive Ion Channel (MscS) Family n=1 Tax=Pseudoloma neurophilia TaxID=146866 RepID=A0A0R0M7P6_9MICR|nr:Small Conductance Mechanosensitive Ion Channel (MscS) Family [Pseudoloma neurophilia]